MQEFNYSLRGRVFEKIREDILEGRYRESDELRELTIAKELDVSRTPVREALRQLELEGLVKIIPNRGAFVTGITDKDVRDIYKIRSLLEGECARWVVRNITPEQLSELEAGIDLAEYYLSRKNLAPLSDLDTEFHTLLYKASASKIIAHTLTDLHLFVQRARQRSVAKTARAKESVAEHRRIFEAIKTKNEDLAASLATEHILNAMANIEKFMDKEKAEEEALAKKQKTKKK